MQQVTHLISHKLARVAGKLARLQSALLSRAYELFFVLFDRVYSFRRHHQVLLKEGRRCLRLYRPASSGLLWEDGAGGSMGICAFLPIKNDLRRNKTIFEALF